MNAERRGRRFPRCRKSVIKMSLFRYLVLRFGYYLMVLFNQLFIVIIIHYLLLNGQFARSFSLCTSSLSLTSSHNTKYEPQNNDLEDLTGIKDKRLRQLNGTGHH